MAKVIRIENTYELGDILANIAVSDEEEVILQVSSDSKFLDNTKDLQIIRNFAESKNKKVNVQNTERFEKVGFVAGGDVTDNEIQVKKVDTPKVKINKPKIPKFSLKIPKMGGIVALVVILVIAVLSFIGWGVLAKTLPKADVTLTVNPEIFTGTKELVAKITPSDDEIKLYETTTEVTGEKSSVPTGEKEVGDLATGEIEIFNKSSDKLSVNAGTKVTINFNGEDLVFVTSESADVDKKTEEEVTNSDGDVVKADVYGKKKVKIEASAPGENYNLSNDDIDSEDVSLDVDQNNITVELSSSTTGGTSKKTTVVSEKDLTDLKDQLYSDLQKDATEKLRSQISSENQLLEGSTDYTIVTTTYSSKVDEEASKLTATMTVKASSYYVDGEDVKQKLSSEIDKLVPENYKVTEGNENISVTTSVKDLINSTSGEVEGVNVSVKVEAFVIPNIDENQIAEDIKGMTKASAEEELSKISNIQKAEFTQKPAFVFSKTLPKKADNITINVVSAEL